MEVDGFYQGSNPVTHHQIQFLKRISIAMWDMKDHAPTNITLGKYSMTAKTIVASDSGRVRLLSEG
jgi:hypothetical protein